MEIITGWTINFERSNRCIHCCGAILDFPDSDFSSGIPSDVASELLIHQQMCTLMIRKISREEWEDKMLQIPDEHGCYRPVSIWGRGIGFNDVAMFFENRPSEKDWEIICSRSRKFATKNKLKIIGFKLIQYKVTRTEKTITESI